MEPITRADFREWAAKHDWFQFGEQSVDVQTPNGKVNGVQEAYVTPEGEIVYPIYNDDLVLAMGKPAPPPPPPQPVTQRLPSGLNIPGFMPPPMGRG